MGLKNRFLLPILLVFGISYTVVEYNELNSYIENSAKQFHIENHRNFYFLIGVQKDTLKAIAVYLANNSIVKKSFHDNNRNLLIDEFQDLWQKLKSEKLLYELHFFKPPAISFVNFSNASSLEKDVSDVRNDIHWITSSFKDSSHILVCKTFAGVRVTYPIISDDGQILGGLSIGQNIDLLPNLYKNLTGANSFIIYKKELIEEKLGNRYFDNFIEKKNLEGEYILHSPTMDIEKSILNKIDFSKSNQIVVIGDQKYSLSIFPIRDFNQDILGYMSILDSLNPIYEEFYNRIFENLIIIIFIVAIIYLIISRNMNSLLERIKFLTTLSQKFQKKSFDVLDSTSIPQYRDDELGMLTVNMIDMGNSLRDFYLNLQEIIDDKISKIQKSAYIDSLTELRNRKALEDDITLSYPSLIIVLDIDNFSNINNFFGTEVGNGVLKESAYYLLNIAKKEDFKLYRVGSDEFGLIGHCNDFGKIDERTERVLKQISNIKLRNLPKNLEITVDFTVGISRGDFVSIESADVALHKAKERKLQVCVYEHDSTSIQEEQKKNLTLLSTIKDGINKNKFEVFFQPILDKNKTIQKYETLVRLFDGEKHLTPYHFLPYAKQTKFYFDITKIVISKSMDRFRGKDIGFSINISADDITNSDMNLFIEEKLQEFPKPENITFEILESEQIENINEIVKFIDMVRKYGVKIAIDDFGSGYSNFSYLLKIRPDYLKIDGSLIKGIATDITSYNITKLIVEFAKESNFKVVAEFVDSEEVFQKGRELKIDFFQGYYLGKPSMNL
jgi:diguanylate cyclase (GGDEF)-like protein